MTKRTKWILIGVGVLAVGGELQFLLAHVVARIVARHLRLLQALLAAKAIEERQRQGQRQVVRA